MKFVLKCPACQEEFEYKPFARGAAEVTCKKCKTKYEVNTRLTVWIFELLMFYIYVNQIQPQFLPTASIPTILIGMVGFCLGLTLLIFVVLNHFLGAGFLFELHESKKR